MPLKRSQDREAEGDRWGGGAPSGTFWPLGSGSVGCSVRLKHGFGDYPACSARSGGVSGVRGEKMR